MTSPRKLVFSGHLCWHRVEICALFLWPSEWKDMNPGSLATVLHVMWLDSAHERQRGIPADGRESERKDLDGHRFICA